MSERIKEFQKLFDVKKYLKEKYNADIQYHGLKDLNNDGYPYFIQWGYDRPIISINDDNQSKLFALPIELGFAIEKFLGTVKTFEKFALEISEAKEKKG